MQKRVDSTNKYYIGKALIDKNISDWDIISINDTQAIYGTGWNFIKAGTKIEDYGNTNNDWLVNYDTGETIQLEENKYVEVSSKDGLAVENGLVFNVDSKNMNTSDLSTWGSNVNLYGFDNTTTGDVISLDGVDDYIEFQAGDNFEDGFTFSFYGIPKEGGMFFSKQRIDSVTYSCRFGFGGSKFTYNISKNRTNSNWAQDNNTNNGVLQPNYNFYYNNVVQVDIKFEPLENKFTLYKNGIFLGDTIVDSSYWNGTNSGKQILEDSSIKCYIGRFYGGNPADWQYVNIDIYSLRLYNRPLNDTEITQNYNKNVVYHNLNQ